MKSSLDLSLPEAPPPKRRASIVAWLTFLCALSAVALLALDRFSADSRSEPGVTDSSDVERLERLGTTLEKRTLYRGAADVWAELIARRRPTGADLGELVYRRAKCLHRAGEYDAAARGFSEVQDLGVSKDLKRRARQHLLECLSALGKEAAREHVAKTFAVPGSEERGVGIAVVGGDEITREDLRAEILDAAREALRAQAIGLSPAQLNAEAAKIADGHLADPERSRAALGQLIQREVLYREGLARGFEQDRSLAERVEKFRRDAIASQVVAEELARVAASVGETDLLNHFEAHRDRFVEPASVKFSLARFPSEDAAAAAVGGDSIDWQASPEPATAGAPVPGIGQSGEISAHLFALAEGETSDRPLVHGGAAYLFRVDRKTPERPLEFEAAARRVEVDLLRAKQGEAVRELEEYLRQKFFVTISEESENPASAEGSPAPANSSGGGAPSSAPAPKTIQPPDDRTR